MVCYRSLTIAALLRLPTSVDAHVRHPKSEGPSVATCSEQAPCISVEVEQDVSVGCGLEERCSFTACVTLDTKAHGCAKHGRGISHLCDKSDDHSFCPNDEGLWDRKPKTKGRGGTAHNIQCQTGGPGDELQFLYKDGKGCAAKHEETGTQTFFEDGGDFTVSCAPSTEDDRADGKTCSHSHTGKECVWTVTLPPCPGGPEDNGPEDNFSDEEKEE